MNPKCSYKNAVSMPCFLEKKIFKGFTIYCHASHIGHVNTILYAFTEPNSKETCYNQLSPLEEITEVVEI